VSLGEVRRFYLEVSTVDFGLYSLGIVVGFAIVRWATENTKFHIRTNSIWLHHWIIAFLWGGMTGMALEGLGRKNWSIRRK
jgi:hypothetical protein